LIDGTDLKEFENPKACIFLYKDYSVAYALDYCTGTDVIAKIYLQEVPEYTILHFSKKQGENPREPGVYMVTDMFAVHALEILLSRVK
jgi:hypothetical protein